MSEREHILCVDDEVGVLEGLDLILGRQFRVETATSGAAGLAVLERHRDIAVVVSDMQMPQMDGATFLANVRTTAPDAVRLLLTGQADIKRAIAAVNEGEIFRFLTKPCTPASILSAIEAACEQRRLITAERVLLEQTLHGTIQALVGVLATVDPIAFARAAQIEKTTIELADKLGVHPRWPLEIAAMLWPVGYVGVPSPIVEKLFHGKPLDEAERAACARVPDVLEKLFGQIPRLEQVRAILRAASKPPATAASTDFVHRAAMVLRLALELDVRPGMELVDNVRFVPGRAR